MTTNPSDLMNVRSYMQSRTNNPANALGIAGDDSHGTSGYHIGGSIVPSTDYSRRESARDRSVTTTDASAFDAGQDFKGGYPQFLAFNRFLYDLFNYERANNAWYYFRDVREIIMTLDGSNVIRLDRLAIRSTGDSSHLFHTHTSFFRDSINRRDDDDNFMGALKVFFRELPNVHDANHAPATEDDNMGASFPARDIPVTGHDSNCIPPVRNGIDGRPAYLNVLNDTNGNQYRLRVWASVGDGTWFPLGPEVIDGNGGYITLNSGQRTSISIPNNVACITASRVGIGSAAAYAGPLTYCVERGQVGA